MLTLEQVLERHGPLPLYNPDGTLAELEPMQKQDIHKLANWERAIGDLPVGYGKTVIATCVALMLQPDATFILVPPILQTQWVRWLKSIPNIGPVVEYSGSPAKRNAIDLTMYDFIVMSDAIFRNDFERIKRVCRGGNIAIVKDEAQAVKNYKSQLFKYIKQLGDGQKLLLMSGTLLSQPGDAYAYIKLTNPGAYPSYQAFENIHVAERDFWERPTKWHNLDLMQTNLSHRRVYRTKEEVHSALPKARVIPIYYDLPAAHMKLYRQLMTEQLLLLEDGGKIDATTAQRLYHAAQQIVTNWGYFAGDPEKKSHVFDLIEDICDEIGLGEPTIDSKPRSKLILWTQYQRTSGAVHDFLNAYAARRGKYSTAAYGLVNSRKNVAKFMDDPDCVELTAQPGSAGAGLNPQHLCWECGFVETPTRTGPFVQSSGRIDRKGQRFNPNIRLFIARGTIQEQLLRNLIENDNLVNQVSGTKLGIKNMIFPD